MFSQGYILWQTIQNSTLAPSSFTSFRPPFFPMQKIVVTLMLNLFPPWFILHRM